MHRLKRWIRRACVLPLWLTAAVAAICFVFLGYALSRDIPQGAKLAAYNLSTYALVICVTALMRIIPMARRGLARSAPAQRLGGSPLGGRLLRDAAFRVWVTTRFTLVWNLLYAVVKLAAGWMLRSVWLATLGGYHLALALVKLVIVGAGPEMPDRAQALRRCRLCGLALLAINLLLAGVTAQVVRSRGSFSYPGPLIYLVALYAFWAVINATVKLARVHRRDDPLLSAAKAVSLTAAMVSMLSLEVALSVRFGGGAQFTRRMTAALGGVVCVVELCLAVHMIARSSRRLREAEG